MDVGTGVVVAGVALVEGARAEEVLEFSTGKSGRDIVADVVRVSEVVDVVSSSAGSGMGVKVKVGIGVSLVGAGPTLGRAWTWPSAIWDIIWWGSVEGGV